MNKILYYQNSDAVHHFLTNNKYNAFMHGANCQATMNSGIARDVKSRIPELYHADLEYHLEVGGDSNQKLGKFSMVVYQDEEKPPHKMAFNLYTQLFYGTERRHFNYGAFVEAMESAISECVSKGCFETNNSLNDTLHVIIPKIGCGLGGGDWDIVSELLQQKTFSDKVNLVFHVHIK
ncbi:MAG: hypothetical protein DSY77_06515 [Bacteroidetes bacterium]|nr:MAG: hypothetical protein DSY77_06515 [Bacteroidota bacterium]